MAKSPASWVGRGKQLLDIRIEGLRDQAFGEDCLLGVCFILGVPHHAQFLRVHDVPGPDDPDRTVQAGTLDPHDRYTPGDRVSHLVFRMVPLKDLSAGGFSFWATLWPAYAELALRSGADVMLAHIRESHRVDDRWLVHCQFICRLSE
jgi:hypothetical protein